MKTLVTLIAMCVYGVYGGERLGMVAFNMPTDDNDTLFIEDSAEEVVDLSIKRSELKDEEVVGYNDAQMEATAFQVKGSTKEEVVKKYKEFVKKNSKKIVYDFTK